MSLIEDLVEDILLRLPVEDLTRFKFVCKSWYSLITTHRFAISHLNHTRNTNKDLGHVRIAMPTYWKVKNSFIYNSWKVVGSCNGLVCFYSEPLLDRGHMILVSNPWTRELRKLPMPPQSVQMVNMYIGFGYDSLTDDYKLVTGTRVPSRKIKKEETIFKIFSLKSTTWKPIGECKYRIFYNRPGILFNGALHWLASDDNASKSRTVLLSFDLSREEFTAIYAPVSQHAYVGIVEHQLCLFTCYGCDNDKLYDIPCKDILVMRCCKDKRYWEQLPDNYEMKYQVVHHMKTLQFTSSNNNRMSFFCDDNKCLSRTWFHIQSPLFVPSLVSPYAGTPSHTKNNKASVESWYLKGIIDGEGQQLQASIRRWIIQHTSKKDIKEIEPIYRQEVGETDNFYFS